VVGRGRGRPVAEERDVVVPRPGHAPLRAALYRSPHPAASTVVAIHGMSPLAERDPRWVQLCRGICRAGLTVVSPHFESVSQLRIMADQPTEFANAARAVCDSPDLSPAGRVGLLSVSFSGGLTIAAAASPPLRHRVSAVCAIGGYADLPNCLRSIFTDEDADPYALLIVLANFIQGDAGPLTGAHEALFRAARANFTDATIDPRDHFGELPPATRTMLHGLLGDRDQRLTQLHRLMTRCADTVAALNPIDLIAGLQAPVTLLHGARDDVIPPEQSRSMAKAVGDMGLPCTLTITDILSHGDTAIGPRRLVQEGPAVIRAFDRFLRACTR
jgi:pimeloyl-ACP methyl ester carboxylesterase